MKAMVLAAGEGTRLRPLTLAFPKPMVPIAGVPLLTRTLRMLEAQGIRDIAVNLYHRPEAIREVLGDGSSVGVRLHYSDETTLMGTAGGVKRMETFLDETFLVLYGDNLYQFAVEPLLAFHRKNGAKATIATFTAPNPSACGLVVTDADGRVTRFQEKPPPEEVFTDQANAGVYVLEPEVLAHIPPDTFFDFGKDVFPALLADAPETVFALPLDGYLQDTGTVPAYKQANWDLIEGRVGPTAEPAIASTALIAPSAQLIGKRNVLGAGVTVGERAQLENCIVWDGCEIEAGAFITDAILGRGVRIGAGAVVEAGAILADGASVGPGTHLPGDTRLAPGKPYSAVQLKGRFSPLSLRKEPNPMSASTAPSPNFAATHTGDELPDASGGVQKYVADYLSTLSGMLAAVDPAEVDKVVTLLYDAWQDGRRLVLCGNGGSASTASHLVCDFQKNVFLDSGRPFEVVALTDSPALLSAWGNDTEFANIFAGQARTWLRKGDVLIAISGSGNSPNVLKAVEVAREVGATSVGFCGYAGGKLCELVDVAIVARRRNMQQVEDVHMILGHVIFSALRDRIKGLLAAEGK